MYIKNLNDKLKIKGIFLKIMMKFTYEYRIKGEYLLIMLNLW